MTILSKYTDWVAQENANFLKDEIKRRHKEGTLKITMGGDDKMSQLALLPIKELFSS